MSSTPTATAPALPSEPRPARAAALLRGVARWGLGIILVAGGLLVLAWLAFHWAILPHIETWRGAAEQRASQALGVPVRIGSITVRSGGWVPALELRDVVLLDAQAQPALSLPRVVAALSPRSLLGLELRFAQLLIDDARLEIRRDAQGRLWVAGLDVGGTQGSDDSGAADWLFQQHEFVIRGGSLRWTDELRGAPPLVLTEVQFVLRNGLRSHDVRLDATPPAEWGERFSLRGRFSQPLLARSGDWRRWSGTAYASLPRADVRELRRHVTLPLELSQGDGALRAWLDVREGQPSALVADVALRAATLKLGSTLEPLVFEQMQGRLSAQQLDDTVTLAASQFGFMTGDGILWPRSDMNLSLRQDAGQTPTAGEFTAQRLDLGLMAQVATRLPLGEPVRKLLAELRPQGIVTGLSLRWEGAPDAPSGYQVKGLLSGLSLASRPAAVLNNVGRPGVRNASLALSATEKGGEAQLTLAAGGTLDLPGVFAEPLVPFDQFSTTLQWRIEPGKTRTALSKVSVQAKNAKFANPDVQGELNASWATGPGEGLAKGGRFPGQLEVNGKLSRGVAVRAARYLPLGLPQSTRNYVARAVQGGSVSAVSFHVKGDLWDFPYFTARSAKDGEFRVAAQLDDVGFAYVPSVPATGTEPAFESPWPALSRVSGEMVFDRATMEVRNAKAHWAGVELSQVQGGIRSLADRSVLVLDGQARGPLADMLRFVNTSPVGTWTRKVLAQSSASGPAELKLGLSIPLFDASAATVKGSLSLAGNDVRISPDSPLLGAAKGRVDFSHKGFTVVGATARLLGGDASFEGGLAADGSLRFNGSGIATAEGLRRAVELGPVARVATALSGQTPYRLGLGFVHGATEINVSSSLVGMAVDLPAPLRKAAETPLPLRYQTALVPESLLAGQSPRDALRFELGSVVRAQYQRDVSGDSARVLRGGLGVMEPAPTPPQGVTANVTLQSIDIDAWERAAARLFAGAGVGPGAATAANATNTTTAANAAESPALNGYVPNSAGLRVQELVAGARRLTKVVAGVSQDGGVWRANLDADQLSGYVEYRQPRRGVLLAAGGDARVYARLTRLSLPKSELAEVENLLDQPPANVPSLDIVVGDFELRGKHLGQVEIEASNRINGEGRDGVREWRLSRLAMTMPEARLTATGTWAAANPGLAATRLPGTPATARRTTQLNFRLELADSGGLLERLAPSGTGKTLRGGKGVLSGDVAWLGSPLALDFASLNGQMNLAVEAGQFLKVDPGAGRLLSVLSLQSLPRRLALDFRDVFQQGFAFDNISGDIAINQGVARSNNLRMRGAQAAVLIDGHADIERETQNLRVVVVPEINAGTASLAYAVINPALGIGTFLAQVFLRAPLIQASTREFSVTGSWADPKVERVQRKLTDAVPDLNPPAAVPALVAVPAPAAAASAALQ